MKVDFYFSYRSPYSYFILPRLKKLIEDAFSDANKNFHEASNFTSKINKKFK